MKQFFDDVIIWIVKHLVLVWFKCFHHPILSFHHSISEFCGPHRDLLCLDEFPIYIYMCVCVCVCVSYSCLYICPSTFLQNHILHNLFMIWCEWFLDLINYILNFMLFYMSWYKCSTSLYSGKHCWFPNSSLYKCSTSLYCIVFKTGMVKEPKKVPVTSFFTSSGGFDWTELLFDSQLKLSV